MPSPCATCHTRCCHDHVIPVNGYDVWRIARGLEYPPERFVQVLTQDKPDSHGFLLDGSKQTFSLGLNKKISPEDGKEACVFWLALDGGATGRCGIYALRPSVCRTYPATMHGSEVVRREDVLCPAVAWRNGSLQSPRWRDDLFRITVEFDIYRIAVARWNNYVRQGAKAEPFAHEQYLEYLLGFYDGLAPVRESIGEEAWSEMAEWWGSARVYGVGPLVDKSMDSGRWSVVIDEVRRVAESPIEV